MNKESYLKILETSMDKVPEHDRQGLLSWIERGINPGDFLLAVLRNDLTQAFAQADIINRHCLFEVVSWLWCEAPSNCWGSEEKVKMWIKQGGMFPEAKGAVERLKEVS